ncbi:MAG: RluA family pseudouridine synthase [Cyanobacteria bacterium P01_H01_bin.130]
MARSPQARSQLTRNFRDRQLTKTYWAIVDGLPKKNTFTVDMPIGRLPHPTLGTIHGATPTGKFAHSTCRVLHRDFQRDQSLIEVDILTGRPHQIRIHLAAAGYPLVNDPLYQVGGTPRLCQSSEAAGETASPRHPLPGDCGYALHAQRLTFRHPRRDRPLTIVAPPPPSFAWS